MTDAARHRHAGHDHRVDAVGRQKALHVGAVEPAGALLADHEILIAQQAFVDRGLPRALLEDVDGDLVVPETHVAPLATRRLLVRGRGVDDGDVLGTRGFEQALGGRDDRVHVIARELVARVRPRVGEIDVENRGAGAEADPPLEATLLIQLAVLRENLVAHLLQFAHGCSS